MMELIHKDKLLLNIDQLKDQWNDSSKPYRYLVYDAFFKEDYAEEILKNYPSISYPKWSNTTYINQKNKFVLTHFDDFPLIKKSFDELNSSEFLKIIEKISGIDRLHPDEELFGGGLHQSSKGAFLDVHVDFNIHPVTSYHRRMNIIIFFNKNWKRDYDGYLELWDMNKNKMIENIEPVFNRCVIFETNEVSFHGHPKPLKTPEGVTRKSFALYYYTQERPVNEIVQSHNTIYKNTQGFFGKIKNVKSGVKAFAERILGK